MHTFCLSFILALDKKLTSAVYWQRFVVGCCTISNFCEVIHWSGRPSMRLFIYMYNHSDGFYYDNYVQNSCRVVDNYYA